MHPRSRARERVPWRSRLSSTFHKRFHPQMQEPLKPPILRNNKLPSHAMIYFMIPFRRLWIYLPSLPSIFNWPDVGFPSFSRFFSIVFPAGFSVVFSSPLFFHLQICRSLVPLSVFPAHPKLDLSNYCLSPGVIFFPPGTGQSAFSFPGSLVEIFSTGRSFPF